MEDVVCHPNCTQATVQIKDFSEFELNHQCKSSEPAMVVLVHQAILAVTQCDTKNHGIEHRYSLSDTRSRQQNSDYPVNKRSQSEDWSLKIGVEFGI